VIVGKMTKGCRGTTALGSRCRQPGGMGDGKLAASS